MEIIQKMICTNETNIVMILFFIAKHSNAMNGKIISLKPFPSYQSNKHHFWDLYFFSRRIHCNGGECSSPNLSFSG